MAKLRTRKHKVVLSRSAGGDAGITFLLVILGAFMFLPMLYVAASPTTSPERFVHSVDEVDFP